MILLSQATTATMEALISRPSPLLQTLVGSFRCFARVPCADPTDSDQSCYELVDNCFATYGVEYKPGFDDGYITWIGNDKPSWTIRSSAFAPDPFVEIGARPIAQEPMVRVPAFTAYRS